MARLPLLAIASVILSFASPAFAAPSVAVLPVEFEGRVPEMTKIGLSERLVEGLAQVGFEVSAGDVLKSALPNQACHDAACYRQVAAKLGLDFLVIAQVKMREKNYSLKLQLVRRDGKPAAPEERETCELCGIQEVGEKLDKLAASLMAKAGTTRSVPAKLTVQSEPSGASVTVDGRAAGETPLLGLDLAAGAHEVTVSAAGHATTQKKVTLEPGIRGLLSVNLLPLEGPSDGVIKATGAWKVVGVISTAVGAAAIGGGLLVLKYADRKQIECPGRTGMPVDAPRCFQNAKLPAGMLIGGGAVAMVTGGMILFVDFGPAPGAAAQSRQWMVSAGGTF